MWLVTSFPGDSITEQDCNHTVILWHFNIFCSIENLHCLQSLNKLENLRFKDNTYNYTNPGNFQSKLRFGGVWVGELTSHCFFCVSVCRNSSYRAIILEMFPNIKVLDGELIFSCIRWTQVASHAAVHFVTANMISKTCRWESGGTRERSVPAVQRHRRYHQRCHRCQKLFTSLILVAPWL